MKKVFSYFKLSEYLLWLTSIFTIIISQIIFGGSMLTFAASLLGVTALIFCAKGNPIGQVLIIIFSLFYGYISFTFSYYGEMITYLGMSAPMAVWALISWVRNPSKKGHSEVQVNTIKKQEIIFSIMLSIIVTVVFCPILFFLNTKNLIFSTISVTTSFLAVYLTARRSPLYALAYALNDVVLIILWTFAAMTDISYLGVIICFAAFLLNDTYGYINWQRMKRSQGTSAK